MVWAAYLEREQIKLTEPSSEGVPQSDLCVPLVGTDFRAVELKIKQQAIHPVCCDKCLIGYCCCQIAPKIAEALGAQRTFAADTELKMTHLVAAMSLGPYGDEWEFATLAARKLGMLWAASAARQSAHAAADWLMTNEADWREFQTAFGDHFPTFLKTWHEDALRKSPLKSALKEKKTKLAELEEAQLAHPAQDSDALDALKTALNDAKTALDPSFMFRQWCEYFLQPTKFEEVAAQFKRHARLLLTDKGTHTATDLEAISEAHGHWPLTHKPHCLQVHAIPMLQHQYG